MKKKILMIVGVAVVLFLAFKTNVLTYNPLYLYAHPAVSCGEEAKHADSYELQLNDDGTIAYLFDDFSSYGNQYVIDGFEDVSLWKVDSGELRESDDYYGGSKAIAYTANDNHVILNRAFADPPLDLTAWKDAGYFTMWIKTTNGESIDKISMRLYDGSNYNLYTITNTHSDVDNGLKNEPEYPDIVFIEGDSTTEKWTDYVIASGWNYVFWRTDEHVGSVDMSDIKDISIEVQGNLDGNEIIFDDLRAQHGLQKQSNPTNGAWYMPHGRPQYGVYDTDKGELRLLNVKNTQYPSNGDHARLISNSSVPMNFDLQVRFMMLQLGHADETMKFGPIPAQIQLHQGERDNTYFRVTYDFEPDWDPGHEWFGSYLALQYHKLGTLAVWPVERNIQQDQEPKAGDKIASVDFTPEAGVKYEMSMEVRGQSVKTTIYQIKDANCVEEMASVSYTFDHLRHASQRYPLAIESTGNMRTVIDEIELVSR